MQAKQRAELDHGNYIYWNRGDNAEEYIKTFWLPYFNVIQICTSHSICGYESNKPWSMLSGNLNDWQVAKLDTRIAFLTADGIFYAISLDGEQPEELILIDINAGKKPNLTGKDLFLFVINDKGIFPRDYDKSKEEINRNCKKNSSNGYSCAAKIMRAGWEMERDYPW